MFCARLGVTVVCTGGVHIDQITVEQIREMEENIEEIGKTIIQRLLRQFQCSNFSNS